MCYYYDLFRPTNYFEVIPYMQTPYEVQILPIINTINLYQSGHVCICSQIALLGVRSVPKCLILDAQSWNQCMVCELSGKLRSKQSIITCKITPCVVLTTFGCIVVNPPPSHVVARMVRPQLHWSQFVSFSCIASFYSMHFNLLTQLLYEKRQTRQINHLWIMYDLSIRFQKNL